MNGHIVVISKLRIHFLLQLLVLNRLCLGIEGLGFYINFLIFKLKNYLLIFYNQVVLICAYMCVCVHACLLQSIVVYL